MPTTATAWKVGQTYWQADGTLNGLPLDNIGEPRRTKREALADAKTAIFWLSDREKKAAKTWVRKYRILALDADGTPGSAVACD